MQELSVCALFFGPHLELAKRCLGSIESLPTGWEHVKDFRLGLNMAWDETQTYVHEWAQRMAAERKIPCHVYSSSVNALKYPMMRKMFFMPLAKYTMWFDDDSYLAGRADFWDIVVKAMDSQDLIGQHWYKEYSGCQKRWLQDQPWLCGSAEVMTKSKFCTGGWWTIRSEILEKYNYPWPELRHKGGDMMLGALCHCQALRMGFFDDGVRINADAHGGHSKAPRRGLSINTGVEVDLGSDYTGKPYITHHQHFE